MITGRFLWMRSTPLTTQPTLNVEPEAQPTTSLAPMSSVSRATSPRRRCLRRKRAAAATCDPPARVQPSRIASGLPRPVSMLVVVSPPQPSLTSLRLAIRCFSIA